MRPQRSSSASHLAVALAYEARAMLAEARRPARMLFHWGSEPVLESALLPTPTSFLLAAWKVHFPCAAYCPCACATTTAVTPV